MKAMRASLQQIHLQMDEEQKVDDNKMQQQIDELTLSVQKLLSGNAKEEDSEKGAFRNWVRNVVNLPEYLDLFIENGVETLDVVAMLDPDELKKDMGITKL